MVAEVMFFPITKKNAFTSQMVREKVCALYVRMICLIHN